MASSPTTMLKGPLDLKLADHRSWTAVTVTTAIRNMDLMRVVFIGGKRGADGDSRLVKCQQPRRVRMISSRYIRSTSTQYREAITFPELESMASFLLRSSDHVDCGR